MLDIDRLAGTEETVTATDLAAWLGITGNRVNTLARDGILPRESDNSFPLRRAVLAYCEHARQGALGRRVDSDLAAEKLRLARETADKVAFTNARARGELLDAREVATAWRGVITDLRAALLAVPSRVAAQVGLDRKATTALDAEMREAMEGIANDG
jgi:phage terminase Nu1 subunit (DNA packaging protein)